MAESPTTPTTPLLLNLDTLVSRSTVRIDGIEYELLSPDEVSILDFKRLVRPGARMVEIEALPEPTAEEKAEYDRILDRQCRQVLLAPDEVHQRLKGAQRDQILAAFLELRTQWKIRLRATGAKPEAATSEPAADGGTTGAN